MLRNHSWQMIERWWAELDSCARVPTVLNNRATGQLLQWPRVMDALLRASWSMQSRRSWSRAAALSPAVGHGVARSQRPTLVGSRQRRRTSCAPWLSALLA